MKKNIALPAILLLFFLFPCARICAKWMGFKPYLLSETVEKALENNALVVSGFFPFKSGVRDTYTIVLQVDEILKKAFDDDLLVEVEPGFHTIACIYAGPETIRHSKGKPIKFKKYLKKGKIYIPCGVIKKRKWFIELKEYADISALNKKFLKRLVKAYKIHGKPAILPVPARQ